MAQKTEVELLPWFHDVTLINQEKLIKYIKEKIPKNSFLAVEVSPHIFTEKYNLIKKIGKESPLFNYDTIWAWVEVSHVCKKKNIQIIPIETIVSSEKRKGVFPFSDRLVTREYIKLNIFAEKTFAEQVKVILKKFKRDKLFVLTGTFHTLNTQKELQKLGVKSKINYSFIWGKETFKKYLKLTSKERAAALKKDYHKVNMLALQLAYVNQYLRHKRKNVEEVKQQILKEAKEKSSREYFFEKRLRKKKFQRRKSLTKKRVR